jgi:PleD family two-component response regulator
MRHSRKRGRFVNDLGMPGQPKSTLARVSQQLSHLEKRDWELLVVGLAALLILLNTYMVTKRLDLRRVREKLISATVQNELVRLQSFTDPLTEVYNRRSLDDMAGRFISHARRFTEATHLLAMLTLHLFFGLAASRRTYTMY